jgi:hypothetical protein
VGWTVDYGVADGIDRFNSTYITNDESSLNIPRYATSTRAMGVEPQSQEGGKEGSKLIKENDVASCVARLSAFEMLSF